MISSLRNDNLGANPHSPFLNCNLLEGRDDGPYVVIRAVHKHFQVFLFWTWDSIILSYTFDVSHNHMICFGQYNMIGDVCHFWGMLKGQVANHQACFLTLQWPWVPVMRGDLWVAEWWMSCLPAELCWVRRIQFHRGRLITKCEHKIIVLLIVPLWFGVYLLLQYKLTPADHNFLAWIFWGRRIKSIPTSLPLNKLRNKMKRKVNGGQTQFVICLIQRTMDEVIFPRKVWWWVGDACSAETHSFIRTRVLTPLE